MVVTFPPVRGTDVRYGADWTFVRNFDAESFNKQHDTHLDATTEYPVDLEPLQGRDVVYHGGEENFIPFLLGILLAGLPKHKIQLVLEVAVNRSILVILALSLSSIED